jgi:hypothetical protein
VLGLPPPLGRRYVLPIVKIAIERQCLQFSTMGSGLFPETAIPPDQMAILAIRPSVRRRGTQIQRDQSQQLIV